LRPAVPVPVVAAHDIFRHNAPLIKAGTPGEITGIGGRTNYTVAFKPPGSRPVVTLGHLSRIDLQKA
jgi:hypothetical protein